MPLPIPDQSSLTHQLRFENLSVWYETHHALQEISIEVAPFGITVIIGPSRCG